MSNRTSTFSIVSVALALAGLFAAHAPAHAQAAEFDRTDHNGQTAHAAHADHTDHAGHGSHGSHAGHAGPAKAVPPVTDAERAAAFPRLTRPMQHAPAIHRFLLFDRAEVRTGGHGIGQAWDVEGWIGGDIERLWLRAEGERSGGRLEQAHVDLLYGRSLSPWWDVLVGGRHDFAPGPSRDWLAVGIQGLAPYRVEVSATAHVGGGGRSFLEAAAEYDLLLTNRLVLQATLEATAHGRDDVARGVGSGLSQVEAGARLRYEVDRRFAPYLGVVHGRAFGGTADLRRADGARTRHTAWVAGIRFWF